MAIRTSLSKRHAHLRSTNADTTASLARRKFPPIYRIHSDRNLGAEKPRVLKLSESDLRPVIVSSSRWLRERRRAFSNPIASGCRP
jgi:hypothetical protein